ncbi:hypothetical protein PpBr36_03437 [Pyricularia pennisetigena]|uniref:hypothetical protein n=1 Tax=Pyricularia pennisetigena TaxID=1578925 RepID=UPI0011506232|nr:hypothetical protein PpBr36_03437 [Pyricularia pennisetigena]TLS31375.1 hypothetical protein PpBr36_03437 [Pyricularia pennisetigena]
MASSTQTAPQKKEDKPADQTSKLETQQKSAALEEDDEFEDFPVDDWTMEETEAGASNDAAQKHLWEESWDDDDTSDDFSQQLKEELKKVEASKRR